MTEEWRVIPKYERYQISSLGRAKGIKGQMMRGYENKGYRYYLLMGTQGKVRRGAHQLVAAAFLGQSDLPLVRHLNGNPADNTLENLAWGTFKENSMDMVRPGRSPQKNQTHCVNGHAYDEANTYYRRNGMRDCRACSVVRVRRYNEKKRQNA